MGRRDAMRERRNLYVSTEFATMFVNSCTEAYARGGGGDAAARVTTWRSRRTPDLWRTEGRLSSSLVARACQDGSQGLIDLDYIVHVCVYTFRAAARAAPGGVARSYLSKLSARRRTETYGGAKGGEVHTRASLVAGDANRSGFCSFLFSLAGKSGRNSV